jgi:hypothetical protein
VRVYISLRDQQNQGGRFPAALRFDDWASAEVAPISDSSRLALRREGEDTLHSVGRFDLQLKLLPDILLILSSGDYIRRRAFVRLPGTTGPRRARSRVRWTWAKSR